VTDTAAVARWARDGQRTGESRLGGW